MIKQTTVGIADMKITRYEGTLITYALGSCVGICLYDPVPKMGAMIHIMLPEVGTMDRTNVYKYADLAIPETLRKLQAFGVLKSRLTAKIAGGAKMFELQGGGIGNIGERNAVQVKQILQAQGIRIIGQDIGKNYARTMLLDVSNGDVFIRTIGKTEIKL